MMALAAANGCKPESHLPGWLSSGWGEFDPSSAECAALFEGREHALGLDVVNGVGFIHLCLGHGSTTSLDYLQFKRVLAMEEIVSSVELL